MAGRLTEHSLGCLDYAGLEFGGRNGNARALYFVELESAMEMNRRELVVVAATLAACACANELLPSSAEAAPPAGGGAGAGAGGAGAGGASAGRTLDVGTAKDYPKDGPSDKFAKNDKVLLTRSGEKLYATSAICTHKACVLSGATTELRCRCHGSRFGLDGAPTKGPATKPLARYAIAMKGE